MIPFLKQTGQTICSSKFEYEWKIKDYFPETILSDDFCHPWFHDDLWFMRLEPPSSAYMLSEGTITLVPKNANTAKMAIQIDYNDTCLLRTMFEPSRQAIRASFRVEGSEKMIATSFTIKCYLCYPYALCPEPILSTLTRDVTQLLADPTLRNMAPDFSLISSDDVSSVSVHRLLLAARSPVFKTLLTMDSQETRSGRMHLKDTSIQTIRMLSDFLYSDQVRLSDVKQAIDLFLFADQYDFQRLKLECETFVSCNITSSAVASLAMQLTTNIESPSIRKAACRFLQAT